MKDYTITISCPYSTLYSITGALDWARFLAKCAHDDESAKEFQHAHELAQALSVNGILNGDPVLNPSLSYIDTEERDIPVVALSELVPF